MKPTTSTSKHQHSPFRWIAAAITALALLLASLAAGAVGHYVLGWF
jgi:hypothetical protein